MPSPAAGVLKALHKKDGDTVTPGTKLCTIEVGATGGAAPSKPAEAPKAAEAPKPPPAAAKAPPSPPPAAAAPPPSSQVPPPPPPPPASAPPPPQAPKASMPVAAIKHAQVKTFYFIKFKINTILMYIKIKFYYIYFSLWKVLRYNYLQKIIHVRLLVPELTRESR